MVVENPDDPAVNRLPLLTGAELDVLKTIMAFHHMNDDAIDGNYPAEAFRSLYEKVTKL